MVLSLADFAVKATQDLIRIDTTNTGDDRSVGERQAAEYVVGVLEDLGLEPTVLEPEPKRTTVIVRLEGEDHGREALVLHGHLDVVPANRSEWSVDPFSGEIRGGEIWGRGAVDMKDMDGMILAAVRQWRLAGRKPPRDIVLCFFADEEASSTLGSTWAVQNRPELFRGASEAVSEVGGFSVTVAGTRAYLIQSAEKGLAWLSLVATGTPGHGSAVNKDNAVQHLVDALAKIGAHAWPLHLTPTVRALLTGVAGLTGQTADLENPECVNSLIAALGPAARFVGASTSTRANVTSLNAGDKVNQIPLRARGTVDLRPVPGEIEAAMNQVVRLAGEQVDVGVIAQSIALEAPFEVPLVGAMREALTRADPGCGALPYMLAGGTDGKALASLGIRSYGFAPLKLPASFDFTAMFHGVDERVPVESVRWGAEVLADFLDHC
jgi:acetylornithine deacetylase/succinyl-diaminopimelate desuccinylase-like protein